MKITTRITGTTSRQRNARRLLPLLIATIMGILMGGTPAAQAQVFEPHIGEVVPRDVREMYDRGLQYLTKMQTENGDWPGADGVRLRKLRLPSADLRRR